MKELTPRSVHVQPSKIYAALKVRAQQKGFPTLSYQDFMDWYKQQPNECDYCKVTPKELAANPKYRSKRLGVDRKDNDLPYQPDNMVLSCYLCNAAKLDFWSYDDFKNGIAPGIQRTRKALRL